ncbi:MAG TPA: hypothetical protein PLL90_06170, partial [Bacteroidales bacterium]|nr:hypothetical protein [Bacteroidales bacterium]
MKNYLILLIVVLFISASTSAQPYKNEDTVVVFQTSTPVPGMINKYLLFKEGNEFGWVDSNYILHKSKISKITAGFLLVDADTVFPADVKSLVLSGPAAFMPSKNQERTVPVKSDTIQSFRVMSYQEFEKLSKTEFIIEAKQHNDPFYKHISAEKYAAEMDKKIQRRNNMFAALDTCPLHYGIKTNIAKDLTNEFNLSFELPIKRDLCIDIGVGVLIPLDFFGPYPATVLTQISEFRDRHITWFDHSYLIRKGF